MKRKRNKIPKRHKYKLGDIVIFKFAGSWRKGKVIELTRQPDNHATYTCMTSGNNRIYPQLGLDGSKETGWIKSK